MVKNFIEENNQTCGVQDHTMFDQKTLNIVKAKICLGLC